MHPRLTSSNGAASINRSALLKCFGQTAPASNGTLWSNPCMETIFARYCKNQDMTTKLNLTRYKGRENFKPRTRLPAANASTSNYLFLIDFFSASGGLVSPVSGYLGEAVRSLSAPIGAKPASLAIFNRRELAVVSRAFRSEAAVDLWANGIAATRPRIRGSEKGQLSADESALLKEIIQM